MSSALQRNRIYLAGRLKAKYRGKSVRGTPSNREYDLELYDIEVTGGNISEFAPMVSGGYDESWKFARLNNVLIELTPEGDEPLWFREDLDDVTLSDVELSDVVREGNRTHGVIEANLYAILHEETVELPVVKPPPKPRPKITVKRLGKRPPPPQEEYSIWDVVYYIVWIIPVFLGLILTIAILFALAKISPFLLLAGIGVGMIFGLRYLLKRFNLLEGLPSFREMRVQGLWTAARIFLLALGGMLAIIFHLAGYEDQAFIFGLFFLAMLAVSLLAGTRKLLESFIIGPMLIVGVMIIAAIASDRFSSDDTIPRPKPRAQEEIPPGETFVLRDSAHRANNDTLYMRHWREWDDYLPRTYRGPLEISIRHAQRAEKFREALPQTLSSLPDPGIDDVYRVSAAFDQQQLNRVYAMLDSLREATDPSYVQFAEAIVSCVQDIPYTLVHDGSCEVTAESSDFFREYHQKGRQCRPNTTFGVLTPSEFTLSLAGDCDTRTLWLYTVLSHFGYEVIILNSDHYRHSILGVELPLSGKHIDHYGRKYLTWETTSLNWKPGELPPDVHDLKHWYVALSRFTDGV